MFVYVACFLRNMGGSKGKSLQVARTGHLEKEHFTGSVIVLIMNFEDKKTRELLEFFLSHHFTRLIIWIMRSNLSH